jgi:hypothetical protein
MYIEGRDMFMRPVLVVLPNKLILNESNLVMASKALHIVASIIEDYMTYPGKVESLVVVIDLEDNSIGDIPIGLVKDIVASLMFNFPCLLDEMYIINSPLSLTFQFQTLTSTYRLSILRGHLPMDCIQDLAHDEQGHRTAAASGSYRTSPAEPALRWTEASADGVLATPNHFPHHTTISIAMA